MFHLNNMTVFKDIPGYENYYFADNNGNIYSKDRLMTVYNPKIGKNFSYKKKGVKLKPHKKKTGYYTVTLRKEGIGNEELLHRIIARTFIPNPNNLPQINHKDENKANNCVDNLEWCTGKYNYYYGSNLERIKNNQKVKSISQYRLDNSYVNSYKSINEAERATGIKHYNIISVCKGNRKTAGGYIWKYNEKENEKEVGEGTKCNPQ